MLERGICIREVSILEKGMCIRMLINDLLFSLFTHIYL